MQIHAAAVTSKEVKSFWISQTSYCQNLCKECFLEQDISYIASIDLKDALTCNMSISLVHWLFFKDAMILFDMETRETPNIQVKLVYKNTFMFLRCFFSMQDKMCSLSEITN